MRLPKKFQRKSTGFWFIELGGKQHRLGKDERRAEVAANKLLREWMRETGKTNPSKTTFAQLLDDYAEWMKKNLAESSYEAKRYFMAALKASALGNRPAESITPLDIDTFIASQPRIKSPTTKHTRITFLIGVYDWGLVYKVVTVNPLKEMPRPQPIIRQGFIPESRFQELLDHANGDDNFRDLLVVTLETGARAQEMFDMQAAHYQDGKFVFDITDSKGRTKSRVVYLPGQTDEIVKRLCKQFPTGPLFNHSKGAPWNKDSVGSRLRRIGKKMGIKGLCLTLLRHSFCHWRLSNKQSPLVVSKLMGHTTTRMIETRYGHVDGSDFLAQQASELSMPLAEKKSAEGDFQEPAA